MNGSEPVFRLLVCVSLDVQLPESKIIKIHLQIKKIVILRVLQPHPVSTQICFKSTEKSAMIKYIVLCVHHKNITSNDK